MSLHPSSESNNGVLVFIDADSKADLQALCGFLKAGLVKEEPERLAEGRFVVSLRPAVHGIATTSWSPS